MDPTRRRQVIMDQTRVRLVGLAVVFVAAALLLYWILFGSGEDTDCGGMFTSSTGTIQSPNYPNDYADNLDCVYVIRAREGHHVVLRFTAFSLETHVNCSYDNVEIRDGGNTNSRLLDKYCGTLAPFTVASSGEQMWINFATDPHLTSTGFRATYTTVAACGGIWTSPKGTIQSPNFPNNYDNNLNCVYVITAPEGHRVTLNLTFTSLSLETHATCSYDYVKIRDGGSETSGPLGIYCGVLSPFTVASSGNQLWINFVTDTSTTSQGFIATYTRDSVKTSTTSTAATTSTTKITSPSMTAAPPSPTRKTSTTRLLTTPKPTRTTSTTRLLTTPSTTSNAATTSTTRLTSPSMTAAPPSPTKTTSTTRLLTTPSPTATAVHVVLTTSKELPFDTDGSQELTLTCSVDTVSQVREYGWSVTCSQQTGNTCLFLPQPEDDGKLVTCTVTLVNGGSAEGHLEIDLNYPPQTPPVINGFTKGKALKAGDDLSVSCFVGGGKPLVHNIDFSCDGHPDIPDMTGQSEVHSVLHFTPVTTEDDGKRCTCTADWKDSDWYHLSRTTILTVNGTEEQRAGSVPVIAGSVVTAVVVIIIIVVVVILLRRRNRHPTYDRPDRPGKTSNNIRDPASLYSGLAPVRGQAFVVSNRSFAPIATPGDGVLGGITDNRHVYSEIDDLFDASQVPSRRPPSTSSTGSYIEPITEPKPDYMTMELPKASRKPTVSDH